MDKSKKDIIFVIPSLGHGGVEICFLNMLKGMNIDRNNITVLNLSDNIELQHLIPEGVKVCNLPKREQYYFMPLKNSIQHLLQEKRYIDCIKRILRPLLTKLCYRYNGEEILWSLFSKQIAQITNKYDIAVAYGDGRTTYFTMDKIQSKEKIAWIHTDHKKAKFSNVFNQKYYEKYDRIMFVSKYLLQQFVDKNTKLATKCKVLYNVLYPKKIKEKAIMEPDIFFSKEYINIVSIGRITHEKGYDYMVKLAKQLANHNIAFKWYIIGEGKEKIKLQKRIKKLSLDNSIIFLGQKENPYPYLFQADIYVQTSRYEGYSTTVTEAKILCKPMLISKVSGNDEQILNHVNGYIEEIFSSQFYTKLEMLIVNEEIRKQLIENLKSMKYQFTTSLELEEEFEKING